VRDGVYGGGRSRASKFGIGAKRYEVSDVERDDDQVVRVRAAP